MHIINNVSDGNLFKMRHVTGAYVPEAVCAAVPVYLLLFYCPSDTVQTKRKEKKVVKKKLEI